VLMSSADSMPGNQACSLPASSLVYKFFAAIALLADLLLDRAPCFLMVSSCVMDVVCRRSCFDWVSSFACVS
jgi:hypothetical protein